MASFMDSPYAGQYMGQLGLGLLAASQPQPPGQNRYSLLMNAFNQANQNLQQSKMFNMNMDKAKREEAQAKSQASARSTLYGGLDPSTGIEWETGRQGLMDSERLGLMAQASPEAFDRAMMQRAFPEPQQPTGPQKDALALGLKPGTADYNEYIRTRTLPRPPQTTVNVDARGNSLPRPKEGFTYKYNENGTVMTDETGLPVQAPIPGGPADIAQRAEETKKAGRDEQRSRYGGIVVQDAQRAIEMVDRDRAIPLTGLGSLLNSIPGTPQHDLLNLINGVKANAGFDRLQIMRENSPTGGALGNVSNFEVDTLQATLGALNQSQSRSQFLTNMRRVMAMYTAIVDGAGGIDPETNPRGWEGYVNEQVEKMGVPKRKKYNPQTGQFE